MLKYKLHRTIGALAAFALCLALGPSCLAAAPEDEPEKGTVLKKEQINALEGCFSGRIYIYLRFPQGVDGLFRHVLRRAGEEQKGRQVAERPSICRRPAAPDVGRDSC